MFIFLIEALLLPLLIYLFLPIMLDIGPISKRGTKFCNYEDKTVLRIRRKKEEAKFLRMVQEGQRCLPDISGWAILRSSAKRAARGSSMWGQG